MQEDRIPTMFGTEYNWLFETTTPADGAPRIRLAGSSMTTLAIAAFCLLCIALQAAPANPAGDAWTINGMDGIIEGLAIHPVTHETFFSDVHNRCIWVRDTSGSQAVMKQFSADSDGLLGVFALKFSADGRTLWASSSALPEMKGYTTADQGRALLAAYDLGSRKLRATYALPADGRSHVLGDFILAADGSVYATDSTAPVIWRLPPGGGHLEKWLELADFKSLQGLVLTADGRTLYVADYANGIWRIATATKAAALLPAPGGANLRGIDGLYASPGGGFIAVQNGTRTQRIIRLALDAAGGIAAVSDRLSGRPEMTDLSLGQVIDGRLHFIANSGWALYGNPAATPAPRSVAILATPAK